MEEVPQIDQVDQNDEPLGVAVAPLLGNEETDEASWVGAALSKLLGEHLAAADLDLQDDNAVSRWLIERQQALPLTRVIAERIRFDMKLDALIHGEFTFDPTSQSLGMRLIVEAEDVPRTPLEASAPLASFPRFVEAVTLALIERLGLPVDDALRRKVGGVARPAAFNALRHMALAQAAWSKKQLQLALTHINAALDIDPKFEEALEIKVALAREANDTRTVLEAHKRWAQVAAERKRQLDAANRLMMLGHWLSDRGEWNDARQVYEEARRLFDREKDALGQARALNNLANLKLQEGDLQQAILTYRRGLRIFEAEETFSALDAARTYLNLSLAHKGLGQREEALLAVEEALELAQEVKDTRLVAHCHAQRGAVKVDLGHWGEAQADYTSAARMFRAEHDDLGLAIVRDQEAILHKANGAYEQAERARLEALKLLESINRPHEMAVAQLNMADLYYAMGEYDRAWDLAHEALDVLARLHSGMRVHAEELIEALEEVPRPPVEGEIPPPADVFPPPPGEEGLYNGEELYNNRDNPDMTGGDEDVNSSEGRTPMM